MSGKMMACNELRRAPFRHRKSLFSSWCFRGILLLDLVLLLPTYSDACAAPPRFSSMMLKGPSKPAYSPGESIQYECRPGYRASDPSLSLSSTCQDNNTWTPLQEACTKKLCRQLGELTNGEVIYEDGTFQFGSRARFVCNEGYYLIGKKIIYCEISGNTVEWSDNAPQCEKILCQPPKQIPNGKYSNSHKDTFEYNEVVVYTCDRSKGPDEYSLVGESKLSCSGQNKWSSDPPECKVVKCPYPVVNNGRLVSGLGKKFYYNAKVVFGCLDGFNLEGDGTIVCGANSSWKPKMPKCIKGVKPTVPTTPISSRPGHATPSSASSTQEAGTVADIGSSIPNGESPTQGTENLDGALITVIILTVLLGVAVVGTCAYKCLHVRKRT